MKRKLFQRVVCLILSVNVVLGCIAFTSSAGESDISYKGNESTSSTLEEMKNLIGTDSYATYFTSAKKLYSSEQQKLLKDEIDVKIFDGIAGSTASGDACLTSNLGSLRDQADAPLVDRESFESYWDTFDDEKWGDNSIYLTTINTANKASAPTWTF